MVLPVLVALALGPGLGGGAGRDPGARGRRGARGRPGRGPRRAAGPSAVALGRRVAPDGATVACRTTATTVVVRVRATVRGPQGLFAFLPGVDGGRRGGRGQGAPVSRRQAPCTAAEAGQRRRPGRGAGRGAGLGGGAASRRVGGVVADQRRVESAADLAALAAAGAVQAGESPCVAAATVGAPQRGRPRRLCRVDGETRSLCRVDAQTARCSGAATVSSGSEPARWRVRRREGPPRSPASAAGAGGGVWWGSSPRVAGPSPARSRAGVRAAWSPAGSVVRAAPGRGRRGPARWRPAVPVGPTVGALLLALLERASFFLVLRFWLARRMPGADQLEAHDEDQQGGRTRRGTPPASASSTLPPKSAALSSGAAGEHRDERSCREQDQDEAEHEHGGSFRAVSRGSSRGGDRLTLRSGSAAPRSTSSRTTAPRLSSGLFPLPHFGDCTHDGQPSSQRQARSPRGSR